METDSRSRKFNSLSLRDLIEARDLYHVHLINKRNVIATAIGRYLIRRNDPWPNEHSRKKTSSRRPKPPRTLESSEVRDYSWPCLLVFVSQWERATDLVRGDRTDVIPRTLYMPDGREVPVCVVVAPRKLDNSAAVDSQRLRFPGNVVSAGFPVLSRVQGETRVASLGCLVTDGNRFYALTNRHVSGPEGTELFTRMAGREVLLGKSSSQQLGILKFSDVYPGLAGANVVVNADFGLIDIVDASIWKTEVFGVGAFDETYDLNVNNLGLELIGTPLRAYGAVTGAMRGQISALFYRYKSVGGLEYVADLMIGARKHEEQSFDTHHGDSGTLWLAETPVGLQPIALHWGEHEFLSDGQEQKQSYALASCLSTVCRQLNLDVVRGFNIDLGYTWGKTGHFKIAARGCELVRDPKLAKLMMANQENIGYTDDDLLGNQVVAGKFTHDFVPLADVADIIWRTTRPDDESNHFADIDERHPDVFDNKTLLELSLGNPDQNLTLKTWIDFDARMDEVKPNFKVDKDGNKKLRPREGALPFRVWQMYKLLIEAARDGDVLEFVALAGTMAHYVGDACQPLHISFLHHGRDASESAVHSDYETKMIDKKSAELFKGVNAIQTKVKASELIGEDPKEAAKAVIALMNQTVKNLPPLTVVQVWAAQSGAGKFDRMWDALKGKTIENIANGCHTLATLWESAWSAGNGAAIPDSKLKEQDRGQLQKRYSTKTFAQSFKLGDPRFQKALGKTDASDDSESSPNPSPTTSRKRNPVSRRVKGAGSGPRRPRRGAKGKKRSGNLAGRA